MAKKYTSALVMVFLAIGAFNFVQTFTRDTAAADAEAAPAVEATRSAAETDVTPAPKDRVGTATLRKDRDGHFRASAQINGATVKVLVDTGASIIALTPRDASRAGLDPKLLSRSAQISTANGVIEAKIAKLSRVRIGGVEVRNVDAVIVEEGLDQSLLGMSFLNKLRSYSVTSSGLQLKQ